MSCLSQPGDNRITSRPKLTLQTTSLPRTFGTSTTGLSLSFAAGAGASPTVRNTFKNAYDVASPSSATASPIKTIASTSTSTSTSTPSHRFNNSKPISPYIHHPPNHPFSYRPYQTPLGVRSILRNSPLEPARRRSGSVSAGTSGPQGTRRIFFPAKKTVSYRYPLEEEIHTEKYTAQHLDLLREEAVLQAPAPAPAPAPTPDSTHADSDSDSGCASLSEASTSDEGSADETGALGSSSLSKNERKKRRSMGVERQVRAVALLDGLESDYSSTPQTPRQGRVKRRREWKWTLGPLESEKSLDSSLPTDEAEPQLGP